MKYTGVLRITSEEQLNQSLLTKHEFNEKIERLKRILVKALHCRERMDSPSIYVIFGYN